MGLRAPARGGIQRSSGGEELGREHGRPVSTCVFSNRVSLSVSGEG